jgi:hypothetical protein
VAAGLGELRGETAGAFRREATSAEAGVYWLRAMEIGDPERTYTVEPLEDPVPREVPEEAPLEPAEVPDEPAQVPASRWGDACA